MSLFKREVVRIDRQADIVWMSEKVHGTNARSGWIDGEFRVGGHR